MQGTDRDMKFASMVLATALGAILWFSTGWVDASQAAEASQPTYFFHELEPHQTMLVSPDFDGDLSVSSLWQSLDELGETYDIKEAKLVYSTWPNVRRVPRLLVNIEPKVDQIRSVATVASRVASPDADNSSTLN